mgnify:CR=1 FL=1
MKKQKNKKASSIIVFTFYLIVDLTLLVAYTGLVFYSAKNPNYLSGNMNIWEIIGAIAILIMIGEFVSNTYDACYDMIKCFKKEKKQCKQK